MRKKRVLGPTLWLLLAATAGPTGARAQESEPVEAARTVEAGPVAVATPLDVADATRAYLDRVPAAERARSDAYFEGGYWLELWSLLWGLGVAWLLLSRRVSARMRDFAERRAPRPLLQTAL